MRTHHTKLLSSRHLGVDAGWSPSRPSLPIGEFHSVSVSPLSGDSVSVVIPAYNASLTITRALDSVLNQSVVPAEIIVVDDGSIDDTMEVVRRYGDRVRLVSQENGGAAAARNTGARLCTRSLIAFLDADDAWHLDKTARQLSVFNEHPEVAICRTHSSRFDTRTAYNAMSPVPHATALLVSDFRKVFLMPYFGTPTVMMRRDVFEACGGFDPTFETGEDVDLWLRASYGRVVAYLHERLVFIANSPTSLTARTAGRANRDNLRVIDAFETRYPEFAARHPFIVREAKASILRRMASEAFAVGRSTQARLALRESLGFNPLSPSALYLFVRTFVPRIGRLSD